VGANCAPEWMSGLEDKGMSVGPSRFGGYVFPVQNGLLEFDVNAAFDAWHHFAYVYNGSYVGLYLDGCCVAYREPPAHISNNPGSIWTVGAIDRGGMVRGFVGYLDSFRISSIARYSGTSFTPPTGDLNRRRQYSLLYNFNDLPGATTVNDLSGTVILALFGGGFSGATSPETMRN